MALETPLDFILSSLDRRTPLQRQSLGGPVWSQCTFVLLVRNVDCLQEPQASIAGLSERTDDFSWCCGKSDCPTGVFPKCRGVKDVVTSCCHSKGVPALLTCGKNCLWGPHCIPLKLKGQAHHVTLCRNGVSVDTAT